MKKLSEEQKMQLDQLYWETIQPAIIEDLGIKPGSVKEKLATQYLIWLIPADMKS
jgi:hypothetical protein